MRRTKSTRCLRALYSVMLDALEDDASEAESVSGCTANAFCAPRKSVTTATMNSGIVLDSNVGACHELVVANGWLVPDSLAGEQVPISVILQA